MAKPKHPSDRRPLRLEYRTPGELAENPRNWRTHPAAQSTALADVMAEVGWAGACLLNERTGRLIDGHLRREIAQEVLGWGVERDHSSSGGGPLITCRTSIVMFMGTPPAPGAADARAAIAYACSGLSTSTIQ